MKASAQSTSQTPRQTPFPRGPSSGRAPGRSSRPPSRPLEKPSQKRRRAGTAQPEPAVRSRDGRPELSVVVITLNEEKNVAAAVRSLLDQEEVGLEVIVVDSASRDRTVPIVRRIKAEDPRVRLYNSHTHLSVGQARNLGLDIARADRVAFMSADATAAPGWARAALDALQGSHVVYGRQEHAPERRTAAAAARGMRYHHFQDPDGSQAQRYASNVNAAVRKKVFEKLRYVDDAAEGALDDVLFTKQAQEQGYTIGYRDDMVVRHKDATTVREELTKNHREGRGWGLLAPQIGIHRSVLAWGALLAFSLAFVVTLPHLLTLLLLALILYLPTLRRAARSLHTIREGPLAWTAGVIVSPLFDLAFLAAYLAGLLQRREAPTPSRRPQGA